MIDWIKKLAGYAPDIATAIATGGTSLAATGLRILGKELLGDETATEQQVAAAVQNATQAELNELQRINNEFKVQMATIETQDKQNEHQTTQETIRNGDNSDSKVVRWTRPGQSWVSLAAAIYYALATDAPSVEVLLALLALPWTYAGLRQVGKWSTTAALAKVAKK